MSKPTLDELLQEPVMDITIMQDEIRTVIHLDKTKDNEHCSITVGDIKLDYNEKRLLTDPMDYLSEQVDTHKEVISQLQIELNNAYRELNTLVEAEMNITRPLQFLPSHLYRVPLEIAKLVVTPICWMMGTTLKGIINQKNEIYDNERTGYNFLLAATEYGSNMFERVQVSEKYTNVRIALEECTSLTKDLSLLYTKFLGNTENKIAQSKSIYKLFFPNKTKQIEGKN